MRFALGPAVLGANLISVDAPASRLPLVFTTPAADDTGSMILGNGEVGETTWIGADVRLVHRVDRFVHALVTDLETSVPCDPKVETVAWHVGERTIPAKDLPSWFGDRSGEVVGRPSQSQDARTLSIRAFRTVMSASRSPTCGSVATHTPRTPAAIRRDGVRATFSPRFSDLPARPARGSPTVP